MIFGAVTGSIPTMELALEAAAAVADPDPRKANIITRRFNPQAAVLRHLNKPSRLAAYPQRYGTPLHIAAMAGQLNAIDWLLDHGATATIDMECTGLCCCRLERSCRFENLQEKRNPLHLAICYQQNEALSKLLSRLHSIHIVAVTASEAKNQPANDDPPKASKSPFSTVGSSRNDQDDMLLRRAVREGHAESVSLLVRYMKGLGQDRKIPTEVVIDLCRKFKHRTVLEELVVKEGLKYPANNYPAYLKLLEQAGWLSTIGDLLDMGAGDLTQVAAQRLAVRLSVSKPLVVAFEGGVVEDYLYPDDESWDKDRQRALKLLVGKYGATIDK
ncbi:hypothetical protein QBC35DRAFT_474929 [Podospora australis]|uniref:Ankyrin repeat protein n=1 Tax=Podospora australis TaxID=1536484 RepID=A0AAN7AHP1_9PEZI|nr:hypothetical protein QBC35DRAFT_474929 [Podospora australis]